MKHSLFAILIVFLALTSCRGGGDSRATSSKLKLTYAEKISDADISLLGKDYSRIAVDASVYRGLMDMLGVGDRCIDFSDQMKLDVERVIASKPDLLLLSAYEGADLEKFRRLGIPIVECTDFLEASPLARAEWMRYFGRLWGVGEKADSLFCEVEKNYKALSAARNKTEQGRVTTFFDTLYGNIWYQPAPQSTLGMMVSDAGGSLPFSDDKHGGSLSLSAEQVLMQAGNADFWLIRSYGKDSLSLDALARMNPVYSQFKAFKEGNIFVCYTDHTHFFEETPFRPDWLLADFKTIFNSGFGETKDLRYFCRLKAN